MWVHFTNYFGSLAGILKAHQLRDKTKDELTKHLTELKDELAQLRLSKITSNVRSRVSKIKVVRKQIARVKTVYNQTQKEKLREKFQGAKYLNKDLREKKTRAMRRALTKDELYTRVTAQPLTENSGNASKKYVRRVVPRVAKRAANFPQRVYAIRA